MTFSSRPGGTSSPGAAHSNVPSASSMYPSSEQIAE